MMDNAVIQQNTISPKQINGRKWVKHKIVNFPFILIFESGLG